MFTNPSKTTLTTFELVNPNLVPAANVISPPFVVIFPFITIGVAAPLLFVLNITFAPDVLIFPAYIDALEIPEFLDDILPP